MSMLYTNVADNYSARELMKKETLHITSSYIQGDELRPLSVQLLSHKNSGIEMKI